MSSIKTPIRVALYGMDERTLKTIDIYLQGSCKGFARVVDELDAEIDIIDADYVKAKDLLEQSQSNSPERPIVLLSLEELSIEGTFFVKKPIQTDELIATITQAYADLSKQSPIATTTDDSRENTDEVDKPSEQQNVEPELHIEIKQADGKHIDSEEIKKTSKHRTATDLTETNFSSYLGYVEGINFSDIEQVRKASFNSKKFFLGYVQSAYRVAKEKGRIMQLNSSWKPLVIFPYSHEMWLDADDKQLRAFAGLTINRQSGKGMSLSSYNQEASGLSDRMQNFYDADVFLWKLAVWTSKGRYPHSIDIERPVYLRRWPNFTRLIITPHAMRISALLISGPRTLLNIAETLNIKPQYVFVFISAANALGFAGQAKRQADQMIAQEMVQKSKSKGLLSKIMNKLRNKGDDNHK